MNPLGEMLGELCKILLPIDERVYRGNPRSPVSVCTLSSMDLLDEISRSSIMSKVNVAGRLLSENKGIDTLVRHVISDGTIRFLMLCGRDTPGHRPGHSLLCLYKNGIDASGRIIGSGSPDPVVSLTLEEVQRFQAQVICIDRIGRTDLSSIKSEFADDLQ